MFRANPARETRDRGEARDDDSPRTPLALSTPWHPGIFGVVLGNYFGQFWPITADPGPSGSQNPILDGLMALGTPHESSGAHLGPYF